MEVVERERDEREKKHDIRVKREMRYYDIVEAKAGDRLPRRRRAWGRNKVGLRGETIETARRPMP